jgi:hypothetical protein
MISSACPRWNCWGVSIEMPAWRPCSDPLRAGRCDEYRPSRRRCRPTSPASLHRSTSSTTRCLDDGRTVDGSVDQPSSYPEELPRFAYPRAAREALHHGVLPSARLASASSISLPLRPTQIHWLGRVSPTLEERDRKPLPFISSASWSLTMRCPGTLYILRKIESGEHVTLRPNMSV